jgi:hypothetical protein
MFPKSYVTVSDGFKSFSSFDFQIPSVEYVVLPLSSVFAWNRKFICKKFFNGKDKEKNCNTMWSGFVKRELEKYYHDRSRRALQKMGTEDLFRIGEKSRSAQFNQGFAPGWQEILKKNRSSNAVENVNANVFKVDSSSLFSYISDLTKLPNRLYDFIFLNILDQYMNNRFNLLFSNRFVRSHHSWEHNITDLEKQEFPMIVQIMNHYDVYRSGSFIQTGSMARAFLVWCLVMRCDHGSHVREVDISPILTEISGKKAREMNGADSNWEEDCDRWA